MHGKRRSRDSGIKINRWLPWRSVRGSFMIVFHGFLLKYIVRQIYSFYLVDFLPAAPWLRKHLCQEAATTESSLVLPTSLKEMVTGTSSQGWWLVLWVWTRVRLSRKAWYLGEDKCKQWWLHGTECHEITEEKIRSSGRIRQRRWSGGTGQVGLAQGALGPTGDWGWGVDKEFQVQGRQRNRNNKVEYFNNDLALGFYYVNLKLFVHS